MSRNADPRSERLFGARRLGGVQKFAETVTRTSENPSAVAIATVTKPTP